MSSEDGLNHTNEVLSPKTGERIPGRDYTIYAGGLDRSSNYKYNDIAPHLGQLTDNDVIADIGSGTGAVAERLALEHRGIRVKAIDRSHELLELAGKEHQLIDLVFDEATKLQKIPDNSVKVAIHGTMGHEINSIEGKEGLKATLQAAFRILEPGGREIWRDMLKPTFTGNVLMRIEIQDGVDNVKDAMINGFLDYGRLSTKALLIKFHEEFLGGHAFQLQIRQIDGQEYFELPAEFAHEFMLRKDYGTNWRQEIQEKYTYWNLAEAKLALEEAGFINVDVEAKDNEWIRENRLKGKVSLFRRDTSGKLKAIEFPTHMVIAADKPGEGQKTKGAEIKQIDYDQLLATIKIDEAEHVAYVGDKTFWIGKRIGGGAHKVVFENRGRPGPETVIKFANNDPDRHNVFKSLTQAKDRQQVLYDYGVPIMKIVDYDREGPPYRYLVQERLPKGAEYADYLVRGHRLTERDVKQIAEIINRFELGRKWQIDTSAFNWARVTLPNGETQMYYIGSTVYAYDENWTFIKMGLLSWADAKYVPERDLQTAVKPTRAEIKEFLAKLDRINIENNENQVVKWFFKYLFPAVLNV